MWNAPGRTEEACLKPPEEVGVRQTRWRWGGPAAHEALTFTLLATWVATVAPSTVAVPGPQDGQPLLWLPAQAPR